ncbi:hypothetical protein [Maribacter polysaccharolyticus]
MAPVCRIKTIIQWPKPRFRCVQGIGANPKGI